MNEFHHHPDGVIIVRRGTLRYLDGLANFRADLAVAAPDLKPPALPATATERIYQPGDRHVVMYGLSESAAERNWPDGDAVIDAIEELLEARARRLAVRPVAEARPLEYWEKRRAAYIAELGKPRPATSFETTVGDVLDDIIREVRAMAAAPATPEFAALTEKIDAIKARFPKPAAPEGETT